MEKDEKGLMLSVLPGHRDALKQEMFERLIHEDGDAWKVLADRLAPRAGHLTAVPARPSDDDREPIE